MSAEISLEKLLEDQDKPVEPPFVIRPLNDEFIRMMPWNPSKRCMCGAGFIKVPRSAIRSVKTTGKTQHCCGKTLQVVTVEFSEEPTLTYRDLFAAVRVAGRTISAPEVRLGTTVPRTKSWLRIPIFEPIFPPDDDDTGGDDGDGEGFTGDPQTDTAKYAKCVRDCILTAALLGNDGSRTKQQQQQWLQEVTAQCQARCFNYLLTGDQDSDGSQ